jgi:flavin-dependent thymidylate synthase
MQRRPECGLDLRAVYGGLFPRIDPHHDSNGEEVTDGALGAELAGRLCYMSFGAKAGRTQNGEYLAHVQDVNHASVEYHPKATFYIGGVSRKLGQQLMRHHVGADRNEEGSPSQESTRFVHAARFCVVPPAILAIDDESERSRMLAWYEENCRRAFIAYEEMIDRLKERKRPDGSPQYTRKQVQEAAAYLLPEGLETNIVWTTNPMALTKMLRERAAPGADAEQQRFARVLARVAVGVFGRLLPPDIYTLAHAGAHAGE